MTTTRIILLYGRLGDWQYANLLRFGIGFINVTMAVMELGGNTRYQRELSQERELLQAQLDRLEVRYQ